MQFLVIFLLHKA